MARREFVVEGGALRRATDRREPIRLEGPVRELRVIDTVVADGSIASAEVVVEPGIGSLTVRGEVGVDWTAPCARCGDPIVGRATADVREIFEPEPTEGETWALGTDRLDLGDMVHELLLLELPFAPAAPIDSDGACATCGRAAQEDPPPAVGSEEATDEGAGAAGDPRWAALAELDLDD